MINEHQKTILMLSTRIPYPLTAGFRIKIYTESKYFKRDGYIVDLMYIGSLEEYNKYKEPLHAVFRHVYRIERSKPEIARNVVCNIFKRDIPFQVVLYKNSKFKKQFLKIKDNYDFIIGNHIRTAEYLKLADPEKVILDLHDAISYNYKNAMHVVSGIKKLVYRIEYPRVLNYECNIVGGLQKVVIISQDDKNWLEQNGADIRNVCVIPTGVRDDIKDQKEDYKKDAPAICFLGKMSYQPNADAVLWFAKNVLPALEKKILDIRFYVMGIEPSKEVYSLTKDSHIIVTGFIDNPYAVMKRCMATVVPIQNGAGLQNKAMESMLVGTPVIASPIAAEGLHAETGKAFLLAEKPAEYVDAFLKLYQKPDLRKQIGSAGRTHVLKNFTWQSIAEKWEKFMLK